MSHAWMPHSPCGPACHPAVSTTVGTLRVVLRYAAIASVLVIFPVLLAGRILPTASRRAVSRSGARILLRALGIRVRLTGGEHRPATTVGTLVVANHVSWTDVLVLAACFPCRFVARGDLVDWPVLGLLARIVRVIPIARERLRALPTTVDEITESLLAGDTVVVFPEGTTWCGTAYGAFRPALFQAAIDAGAVVRPVGVTYRDETSRRTTATAFVGDEGIGGSMGRIVRLRGVRAEVRICDDVAADPAATGRDARRSLARRAEAAVRSEQEAATLRRLRRSWTDSARVTAQTARAS